MSDHITAFPLKYMEDSGIDVSVEDALAAEDLVSRKVAQLSALTCVVSNPTTLAQMPLEQLSHLTWLQMDLVRAIEAVIPSLTHSQAQAFRPAA